MNNNANILKEKQKRLDLNLISYDLDSMWKTHSLINTLRDKVCAKLPKDKHAYDPQDLEHQVLFRLTTFDPNTITDGIIDHVIDEQFLIMQNRLHNLDFDLDYLFRGLTGKYHDLNVNDRLNLEWHEGKLVAQNNNRSFNVEFRIVHDEKIVSLFSNELHYIHRDRPKGETFGLYFSGDEIPWAIETTEPSVIAKQYKRDALLANGIDPNKAIELTRFYTLPGAPTNAISVMDGLVARYYKEKGIEALFTTTMPMYSKTKSTTIAGGINKPLLVKNLRHKFIPEKIKGKICYRHVTTVPEDHDEIEVIKTHQNFPTMLTVEVYRKISEGVLDCLPALKDSTKTIYVLDRENKKTEKEIKIIINDVSTALKKIRELCIYSHTDYIRDIIFGQKGEDKKIRLRVCDNFNKVEIDATCKYKESISDKIKKEVEETIYRGNDLAFAKEAIMLRGEYVEENSYEKVRVHFKPKDNMRYEVVLDMYVFGSLLEIEGEECDIDYVAKKLGYDVSDYNVESADELYLKWIKKHNLPEMWDVRFGLLGKK